MKEQVLRILRMVQEGRLSPDDAYELMSAFTSFDGEPPPRPEETVEAEVEGEAPETEEKSGQSDPFKRLVDSVEKLTKEGMDSVDWKEVASSVKSAAKRGVETLRASVEQMSKGEFKVFWASSDEVATVELPLHVAAGKNLRIEWTRGDVVIRGGRPIGSLKAVAKISAKSSDEAREKADAWTPIIEENDGNITLRQSPDTKSEDLELEIPEGVSVDIRTEAGDISVEDTKGSLRISSVAGDVRARRLNGVVEITGASSDIDVSEVESASIEIEVKSGDVKLSAIKGNVKVRSASGDVRGKELAGRSISVETVDGDVDLDVIDPLDGALSVRTVNGDVLVDLAGGSNCRVALSSLSGKAQCDFELEDEKRAKERITGKIGAGDGTLDISAVRGDVSLSLRDHFAQR